MAVSINSVNIPSPMNQRGHYQYLPHGEIRKNGEGASVTAGTARAMWRFRNLTIADWEWWTTTLMSGAASLTSAAVLWDDGDDETSFSSVTVRYPTSDGVRNGRHQNVEIVVDTMILP